jgi:hypothetical protein
MEDDKQCAQANNRGPSDGLLYYQKAQQELLKAQQTGNILI